ncbi:hypothetical protein EAH80_11825 [Mycobacterium hodleri]|uniref:Uncharacterized protein n=1 Tax=Mycolicibacterium hodleri TaxID=49897 RepID=A0A502E971_9MYCO|nr:hypothetical protein EAH80_11825 [Mycolicibacterium hodleri]
MTYAVMYLLGCLFAMVALVVASCAMEKSHGMSRGEVALVTLSAGLLWPLLLIAVVQAAGLLGLKKALGVGKSLGSRRPQPVEPRPVVHSELAVA